MAHLVEYQIVQLVKELADRMRDPDAVIKTILDPKNRNNDPPHSFATYNYWSDLSLAGGSPGVLLLLSELDRLFPDEKWDAAAHAYVLRIKAAIEMEGVSSLSLYGGLTGVCFALQKASRESTRYKKLIASLNSYLVPEIEKQFFIPLQNNLRNGQPSDAGLYDAIVGLSGIGIYGLNNLSNEPLRVLTERCISLLVDFTQPLEVNKRTLPGWYLPSSMQFLDEDKLRYPKGNFNLGLAHGIPGVLAFLSIASLRGVIVKGQKEAIERVSGWIKDHRRKYRESFFWKSMISYEEEIVGRSSDEKFSGRDAWCYGSPGVTSSLLLAGKALEDKQLQTFTLESFSTIFKRTYEERHLPGPTFCHGIAGLLKITQTMAQAQPNQELENQKKMLIQELLSYYSPMHPFGFQDMEPCKSGGYVGIDQAGLLEGASGILLTLLSLHTASSWWDAPFLISNGQ